MKNGFSIVASLPATCADVIRHPEDFAHLPSVRLDAWMAAKEAQGHPITADQMAHLPSAPWAWSGNIRPLPPQRANSVAAMIDKVKARTQARIRAHAATQGYPLHPNNGGAA